MMLRKARSIPFEFVLEQLFTVSPTVRPMFGCFALYVSNKIVLILRNKEDHVDDNGVWIATTIEHHSSLKKIFPSMRSIKLFGSKESSWQNLPKDSETFEEDVIKACELVLKGDNRIGKIPKPRKKKRS